MFLSPGGSRPLMQARRLLSFAAPYRWQLLLAAVLAILSSLAMLAVPLLAARLFGNITAVGTGDLGIPAALLAIALMLVTLLNFAVAYVAGTTSARLFAHLRVSIYDHLQALPLGFHENQRQGDVLALMSYETARLSQFLTGTLTTVPSRLLTVLGAIVLMFRLEPRLALLVPLMIPVFYLVIKLIGRRLRKLAHEQQQAEAGVVAIAEENLAMLPAIKAFTREQAETGRYRSQIAVATELSVRQSRINAALEPALSLAASLGAVLLILYAGQTAQAGAMTPTQLFGFLFYAALLARPIGSLADIYGQLQTARGTLARLDRVLEEQPEPGYAIAQGAGACRGEIVFDGLSFAFPGRDPVLSGLDLHIQPGEIVALTGRNGAGKTTLINLLSRYYEPDRGEIRIDGCNIARINLQDLRRRIGLVSQRVLLFNGTIAANIAFGCDGAEAARIEAAARLAQAYDFIIQLPQGFDTEIGDHGVRLSGGQRQRIALARALLKDPQILILDEATAMFDLEGETAFVEACAGALAGRTVILITHRPASLALAHRILEVGDGRIGPTAPALP